MVDIHTMPGERPKSRLYGWGTGGVVNPPKTSAKDNAGQSNISLQCTLEHANVFTVQFGIHLAPLDAGSEGVANLPVADIEWAVNGNTVRRRISVLNGATITGDGESVKVKVYDESQNGAALPFAVSILVTLGTRGGDQQPTLQDQSLESLPHSSTATFQIPDGIGASQFRIFVWSETAKLDLDKIVVLQQDVAGNTITGYQNPALHGYVAVAPGASQVLVSNIDTVNDASVYIVFGIDG